MSAEFKISVQFVQVAPTKKKINRKTIFLKFVNGQVEC